MLTALNLLHAGSYSGRRGMSGCAPDCALTFFASPKKVSKERRAHVRAASRCLALLASRGVGLNSLRSNNARPDPLAAALLSPASMGDGRTAEEFNTRSCAYWVCSVSGLNAVMRRRVAQAWSDEGWRCLSEASLARPRPGRATQLTGAKRRATNPARLSVGDFSLAKQRKVTAQSGAHPDLPSLPAQEPACSKSQAVNIKPAPAGSAVCALRRGRG